MPGRGRVLEGGRNLAQGGGEGGAILRRRRLAAAGFLPRLTSFCRPADLAQFLAAVMEGSDEIFIVLLKEMLQSDAAATCCFRVTKS